MIPEKLFITPMEYGAKADGKTLDTTSIQTAIDQCASHGGGTVFIPAGHYLTGTIFFRDNINLYLDSGTVLLASQNPADFPVTLNRWEGTEQRTYSPIIAGNGLKNISITGRGEINGQGEVWWKGFTEKTLKFPRPRMIGFSDSTNVLIEGITLRNSPAWTVNPVRCENVIIRGLTVLNPPDSPNTDGINPDSCRAVRISDCYVSVGDDCITIKSGTQFEHPGRRAACRDIIISNCVVERGHGGVVIGSEMSGDVKNVTINNCLFFATDRGIRMKSRRGRGGVVENIQVNNVIMDGVLCPFTMNLYYNCNGAKGDKIVSDKSSRPVDEGTPIFRNIHYSNIIATRVSIAAGYFYGLAEMPLQDISLTDVFVTICQTPFTGYPEMADDIPSMSQVGFFFRNSTRVRLERVTVTGQTGPVFDLDDSVDAEIRS